MTRREDELTFDIYAQAVNAARQFTDQDRYAKECERQLMAAAIKLSTQEGLSKQRYAKVLGDIFHTAVGIANTQGLSIESILEQNLEYVSNRFGRLIAQQISFDESYASSERLPREITFELALINDGADAGKAQLSTTLANGEAISLGDRVTDNTASTTFYRFHDSIHISLMGILGWSPVMRRMLKRKRKSVAEVDEVEDGARAAAVEEAVATKVFEIAGKNDFFADTSMVSFQDLSSVLDMVAGLEVARRPLELWEKAIVTASRAMEFVRANGGARMLVNTEERTVRLSTL